MAKLFCSKIEHNPFKETQITEITEKVFVVDGYTIADRLLEGIEFSVSFDDNGVTDVTIDNTSYKEWFEDTYNSKKYYKEAKKHAESILKNGDEVDVPQYIKNKYFKNGINNAFISQ